MSDREWTVADGALTLEEDLRISDHENFYFGEIRDVVVDGEGRIYVADAEAHHVKVLSPEGELVETLGQEGEGPGEFKRPRSISVGRGDSVYVMDAQRRVTAFAPESHELAYTVALDAPEGRFPASLLGVSQEGEGFLVEYGASIRDPSTHGAVQPVRYDGQPTEDVFFVPRDPEYLTDESGDIPRSMPKPFSRSSHVAVGPEGALYHAETGALNVEIYGPGGSPLDTISVPYTPVPVTSEDIAHLKERFSIEWAQQMIDEADLKDTKPAFEHFLVDDRGHYWFGRPMAHPDSTAWWRADPEKKQVLTTTLPSEVRFIEVRNGFAYGETTTEQGAPALVRYRIQDDS